MGYANDVIDQYDSNSSLIAPQFIGTELGGTNDLQSIKCPESAYGKIFLMVLNGDGSTKKCYNWVRKRISGVWNYGWVDSDDAGTFPVEGVKFAPGDAFWVQNDGAEGENTFNTSGAVNEQDVDFLLATDSDSAVCGNCTPASVDLQDLLCPETAYGKIFLMTLNGDGSTKKCYNWVRKRISGVWNYGWVDSDDAGTFPAEGVTFKPGQGFWVQNDGSEEDAFTLTIPGVEL